MPLYLRMLLLHRTFTWFRAWWHVWFTVHHVLTFPIWLVILKGSRCENHTKRKPCASPYHAYAKEFSLSVQDQGGADQTNWTLCLFRHGPMPFNSNRISLKASRLTPDHRRRHILADRSQSSWNRQHRSHAIFDDGSRVNLYFPDRRADEFLLFLGCNNPLAFQQNDEKPARARPLQL